MLFTAVHFSLKAGAVMKLGAAIDGNALVGVTAHAHDRTTIRIELAPPPRCSTASAPPISCACSPTISRTRSI